MPMVRSFREPVADKSPKLSARIKSVNKAASDRERSRKVREKYSIARVLIQDFSIILFANTHVLIAVCKCIFIKLYSVCVCVILYISIIFKINRNWRL